MAKRLLLAGAIVAAAARFVGAVSVLLGVEPGKSTRADAERVFGPATANPAANVFQYAPKGGAAGITITYRAGTLIVDRIDLTFQPSVAATAAAQQLGLTDPPTATSAQTGRLVEYFGGSRSLVLTHEGADAASGIALVAYQSRELFDGQVAALGVKPPAPAGEPSVAVSASNAKDQPVIEQMNPAACSDIYYWAQNEQEVAKRSKNVARRQLMLDILISSQKGDCPRAREKAALYKQAYQ